MDHPGSHRCPGRPKMAQITITQSSGDSLWQKIKLRGGQFFFFFSLGQTQSQFTRWWRTHIVLWVIFLLAWAEFSGAFLPYWSAHTGPFVLQPLPPPTSCPPPPQTGPAPLLQIYPILLSQLSQKFCAEEQKKGINPTQEVGMVGWFKRDGCQ